MNRIWVDEQPFRMDPAALVKAMEATWEACAKYGERPTVMCIPGGLWLRIDGWVSDDLRAWREPREVDRLLIDRFRALITASDFAFPKDAGPKHLAVEPVRPDPSPCWHKHRGSRRR